MLVKDKLEFYREILLKEKEAIIRELIENNQAAREIFENDQNNVNDAADEASLLTNQNILNVMESKQKQTLIAIDAALKRIEEGTFGICISCGSPISEQRLSVVPWASMCIDCKNKEEKKIHK